MRGSKYILHLALALTASAALTGCLSTWEDVGSADATLSDTPVVSGNTFDRYNDLAVIPPYSENLSISYRYELDSPEKGEAVPGVNGPVWFYVERSAAAPESFFQIGLVSSEGEAQPVEAGAVDDPIVETIRLGSIRYRSTLYCVDPMSGAVPAAVEGFVRNVAAHGHGLSNSLFVRHYEGEGPGLDGRWLSMAFVLDITRKGYDCASIGDPSTPDLAVQGVVDDFKDAAARSFEVVR